jgi:hypothetical protein
MKYIILAAISKVKYMGTGPGGFPGQKIKADLQIRLYDALLLYPPYSPLLPK